METDKIDADDITKIQDKTKTTEYTAILYGHSSLSIFGLLSRKDRKTNGWVCYLILFNLQKFG